MKKLLTSADFFAGRWSGLHNRTSFRAGTS
jgi:hypothetical protein